MHNSKFKIENSKFILLLSILIYISLVGYKMGSISPTQDELTDLSVVDCIVKTGNPFSCLEDISQTRLPFLLHVLFAMLTGKLAPYILSLIVGVINLVIVYRFTYKEFSPKAAALTAILFATSIPLLASGRMVLSHSNIIFTTFSISSFFSFYVYLKDNRNKDLYLTALFFGLSLASCILALANVVFFAGMFLYKKGIRSIGKEIFIGIFISVLVFFCATVIYFVPENFLLLINKTLYSHNLNTWNYLGLNQFKAPGYFSWVIFIVKINPLFFVLLILTSTMFLFKKAGTLIQREFIAGFLFFVVFYFFMKSVVWKYDAPHQQIHLYPIIYMLIAIGCVFVFEHAKRFAVVLTALILAAALSLQLFDMYRFFPNYIFYGSQYGRKMIGEFYGPAVSQCQDLYPIQSELEKIDADEAILVSDANCFWVLHDPRFVKFSERDTMKNYRYALIDLLHTEHLNFNENKGYKEFIEARYCDYYVYNFPVRVPMYRIVKKY